MSEEDTVDVFYDIFTWMVVPFWALIIVFPAWKLTNLMIRTKIIHICYSIIYAIYMLISQYRSVGTPSCDGCSGGATDNLISSLTNKYTLTGAWVHYLVFDFFVGCWMVTDSREQGVPHILVVPCLLLTLFLGPVGFLAYWGVRLFFVRQVEEEVENSDVEYTKNRWFVTCRLKFEATRFMMIWFGTKSFWKRFVSVGEWWNGVMIYWKLKTKLEDEEEDDVDDDEEEVTEAVDISKIFEMKSGKGENSVPASVSENDVLEVKSIVSNEEEEKVEVDREEGELKPKSIDEIVVEEKFEGDEEV